MIFVIFIKNLHVVQMKQPWKRDGYSTLQSARQKVEVPVYVNVIFSQKSCPWLFPPLTPKLIFSATELLTLFNVLMRSCLLYYTVYDHMHILYFIYQKI